MILAIFLTRVRMEDDGVEMTEKKKQPIPKKKNISKLSEALKRNIRRRKATQNKKASNVETNIT